MLTVGMRPPSSEERSRRYPAVSPLRSILAMELVEWRPRHRDGLDRALGTPDRLCAQARRVIGPAVGGPQWRFTLVAEVRGEPVGGAVAFAPRWHAQRVWVSVEVAADSRRH